MNSIDTLTTADRLALTLEGLCRAVAARIAGGAMAVAMILLVWRRVQRGKVQLQGLLARFRAGRLRVGGARKSGGGGRQGGRETGVPRRFGWLLPLVPGEAACFAGQLRTVLAEPEMSALLEASPQARRVLAPLCRMLGIEAPARLVGDNEIAEGSQSSERVVSLVYPDRHSAGALHEGLAFGERTAPSG